jgi:hypothetical protein
MSNSALCPERRRVSDRRSGGTDAEYTAFAAMAVGQFEAIEGHPRALREVSDILNNR